MDNEIIQWVVERSNGFSSNLKRVFDELFHYRGESVSESKCPNVRVRFPLISSREIYSKVCIPVWSLHWAERKLHSLTIRFLHFDKTEKA